MILVYIIAMIRENGTSYYCNLASPYYLDSEALKNKLRPRCKSLLTEEKRLLDVKVRVIRKK